MIRRGFTLIELLAAVFISSIVVAAAFTMMTSTSATFSDEDERRKLKSNLRIAELLLQRDISRTAYMFPYDTKAEQERLWTQTPKLEKPAFIYHNSDDNFSKFTLIASLSDYLEFKVERIDGNSLCISPQLTLPLTAADIGNLGANANPVSSDATESTFWSAFSRTFKDAEAIAIQNATGEYIVTKVKPVTPPPTPDSGNCAYAIEMIGTSGLSAPTVEGFEGSSNFEDCNIFPVTAITYLVMKDALDVNHLLRCKNDPFNIITDVNTLMSANRCETLVHNIQYFEAFPLANTNTSTNANSGIANSYFNSLVNTADKGLNTPFNTRKQHEMWKNIQIRQLRGVYFRFGAGTPTPVASNVRIDNTTDTYPAYVSIELSGTGPKIYPFEHLQGIAPFRIPFSDKAKTGTMVVPEN